jgi:hypothetical protein
LDADNKKLPLEGETARNELEIVKGLYDYLGSVFKARSKRVFAAVVLAVLGAAIF